MNTEALGYAKVQDSVNKLSKVALAAICGSLCFVLPLCITGPSAAQEKPHKESGDGKGSQGAGIYFNAEAGAKDVGLPVYPGARPQKEKNNDSDSVKMRLGRLIRVQAGCAKAGIERFAGKSRGLLQEGIGQVRNRIGLRHCSSQTEKSGNKSSKQLTCEDDKPKPGEMLFKAGTKEKQRLVRIEPNGSGSVFQLVSPRIRTSRNSC